MTVFGWDASDFDWSRGPMNLAAAVKDGIQFFTHKATEGTRTKHVHYGEALTRARAAGMPLMGAYIVPRTPGNNGHGSIAQQVAYALAYLDAQTPWWRATKEFFLQVDTEHWGYDDVHPRFGAEMCLMLRAQTGKWVVHYAPRWAYGNSIPGDHPLWASAYGSNPAVAYRRAYRGDADSGWAPYSGRTPTFLQFGSQATIGSQSGCDINAYRGSLEQLRALITGGDEMSAQAESILAALANGSKNYTGADGKEHVFVPTAEIYRQIDHRKATGQALTDLASRVAGLIAPAAPTQEQVTAAVTESLKDPAVARAIGGGILDALRGLSQTTQG